MGEQDTAGTHFTKRANPMGLALFFVLTRFSGRVAGRVGCQGLGIVALCPFYSCRVESEGLGGLGGVPGVVAGRRL